MKINNLNIGEFFLNKNVKIVIQDSIMDGKITDINIDCNNNLISLRITMDGES